jgi:hypothetical protein
MRRPDHQLDLLGREVAARSPETVFRLGEGGLREPQERPPLLREHTAPGGTLEELSAELILELADALP